MSTSTLMQQIQIAGERGLAASRRRIGSVSSTTPRSSRSAGRCTATCTPPFTARSSSGARASRASVSWHFKQEVLRVVERQIAAGETAPLCAAARAGRGRAGAADCWSPRSRPFSRRASDSRSSRAGRCARPRSPTGPSTRRATRHRWSVCSPSRASGLPSLRADAARVREAKARVTVADREAWPRPSLGVQYRREGNPSPRGRLRHRDGRRSLAHPELSDVNQGERARARADDWRSPKLNSTSDARLLEGPDRRSATARSSARAANARATGPRSFRASRRTSRCFAARSSSARSTSSRSRRVASDSCASRATRSARSSTTSSRWPASNESSASIFGAMTTKTESDTMNRSAPLTLVVALAHMFGACKRSA